MTGDDATELIRHEEELTFDTVAVPYERVRVRREVVTEEVQVSVTLHREVLRIEREPLERPSSMPGEAVGARPEVEELEIVLHEELPVVSAAVVPYERVRVRRETVQGETSVTVPRRVERVDVERPGVS